ncbi:splicing factor, suppressor of white-apricot homolog isoform X3 [Sesamum indicum]|nr:splicing factor, suppressor of white-apricot homolog isoform X3 [Sesamum indicum]
MNKGCNIYLVCAGSILLYCIFQICRKDVKCDFLLRVTNVEDDEHRPDSLGYRAVAFSYGNNDSADQRDADAGAESSGFLPPFPIPGDLLHCLPPTEKAHQIIARTAMFVSKNGGQSEIILRVKQGDNPTFGFLMPGHHLHAYFRFLVDHPELLNSESDGNSQDERIKGGGEPNNSNGVGGALSLLGSVYGSGEEEEGDDTVKTERDASQDSSVTDSISHGSKKIESQAHMMKDESVSRNPILSNKEKVLTVKKNSLINASKSGTVKGMEEKSRSVSAAADKAKSLTMGMTSKIEPLIVEPPPELKRLIDKIVEFIMRNGKQFEATLIEQDSKHGRFPFLLPSNQYHSYYLKVLQTTQESRVNGKSLYPGKDDLVGRRTDKKASVLKEKDFSLDSAVCDMPLESDRKEKFKMVIGKSKKDIQETESKGAQQECGITVDAAAAAAILQAATRGIKNSNLHIISSTSPGVHVNSSEVIQPGTLGSLPSSRPGNAVEKSGQSESHNFSAVATNAIARTVAGEAAGEADSAEAHLTKEQKLKAERLKRAKLFVAMLKSGEVPFKAGTSRGSSLEPLDSGVSRSASEVNLDGKDREGSLAPVDLDMPATGEKREKNYFGEEHAERLSKRKYRSRAGGCEDVDEDDYGDENTKEHESRSRRNSGSRSRRHDGEDESAEEMKHKHHRKRHRHHSSSEENEDKGESSEEDRDHKRHKSKHRSHRSQREDECEDKYKEDRNHKRSRKKHRSHSSSHEHSRKRRSSKQYLQEDNHDDHGIDKKSRKKHHSHRSRDKHRHKSGRSSRDKESRRNRKHDTSSDDDRENSSSIDKHKNGSSDERNELEEGEISYRVSDESRGIAGGHISRETSIDVVSSLQRASSQPSETITDVPDDLRAKIRAMLMATRV